MEIIDLRKFEINKLKEENDELKKCLLLSHLLSSVDSSYQLSPLREKIVNLIKFQVSNTNKEK